MQLTKCSRPLAATLSCLIVALTPSVGHGQVVAAGAGAFAGFTPVTFTGLPDGTEVNGLSVSGILFSYSLGNGQVIINGGPGVTNNVAVPNIVSVGNATGILTLILPDFSDMFGFGYAVLNGLPVPNATTITLFNGVTNLGSLAYDGSPDPIFAGGFAGIQSTTAFNRVELTFSAAAQAFALDNLVMRSTVPEPATTLLVGAGLVAVFGVARRKRNTDLSGHLKSGL